MTNYKKLAPIVKGIRKNANSKVLSTLAALHKGLAHKGAPVAAGAWKHGITYAPLAAGVYGAAKAGTKVRDAVRRRKYMKQLRAAQRAQRGY